MFQVATAMMTATTETVSDLGSVETAATAGMQRDSSKHSTGSMAATVAMASMQDWLFLPII